ncbi:D-glycero-alpha-D-manno-heptose-1,7-bisphosphate 7-phosphatase [Alkaliphilus hydrothermalis]|uniref:D,D-heptose 1,7-bisphosphate phosphatase n=1 Tax=Alkaliphilus hydrothermalis TaxID=1482730 RepID=A0ABS2NQM8_9FIRM|nr:HAD-IIIA family hydrolase [Alkaliphilus hydrothermalis]MBM7615229.1 D-glycero-D-manno-heptose 1,7-bisphosphate phosphatase [Alkaliphilus hydrothermalis]
MKKAIFFDRDGVLNDNINRHVNKPEELILYDGVPEALKMAKEAGFELFVVTNQGGIELGHLSHEMLKKIHDRLEALLEGYCKFKEIIYCPDFKKPSECRKPAPGMILELAEKHNIDLINSWMVGDRDTDITAGKAAGCFTVKIGDIDSRADINELDLPNRRRERKVDLEAVVEAIIEESE